MDIVELRNVVRAMRAEKIALDYMDEVLSAVGTAQEALAKTQEEIAGLTPELERLTAQRSAQQAEADRAVQAEARRTAEMLAERKTRLGELDGQIRTREQALATWQAKLASIEQEHHRRLADLNDALTALTAERVAAAHELERT